MDVTAVRGTFAEAVRGQLLGAQNEDGGWGAVCAAPSNTEATALAVLALSRSGGRAVERGLAWLERSQRPDGSWSWMSGVVAPSWATSLAVLSLTPHPHEAERARRGGEWLLRQHGCRLGWRASLLHRYARDRMLVRLDPDLRGWPWTPGAFTWVEPTAYAMLALRTARPLLAGRRVDARLAEGERVLYDRVCAGGGWNYGNPSVFGVDARPYPELTAVALLALDTPPSDPRVADSAARLAALLDDQAIASGLSLAFAALYFSRHGAELTPWIDALSYVHRQTGFLGDTKSTALALLAADGRRVGQS